MKALVNYLTVAECATLKKMFLIKYCIIKCPVQASPWENYFFFFDFVFYMFSLGHIVSSTKKIDLVIRRPLFYFWLCNWTCFISLGKSLELCVPLLLTKINEWIENNFSYLDPRNMKTIGLITHKVIQNTGKY